MSFESASKATTNDDLLRLTADITAAYLTNNAVPPAAIADLIRSVHGAVHALDATVEAEPVVAERPKPAVPIGKSVGTDYIVCLEDGKRLKMLKRYLRARFNLTPDEYRRRWNLPADYPMVAPDYAQRRSVFAKSIGLGKGVCKAA